MMLQDVCHAADHRRKRPAIFELIQDRGIVTSDLTTIGSADTGHLEQGRNKSLIMTNFTCVYGGSTLQRKAIKPHIFSARVSKVVSWSFCPGEHGERFHHFEDLDSSEISYEI